jgi:hypothetical protein
MCECELFNPVILPALCKCELSATVVVIVTVLLSVDMAVPVTSPFKVTDVNLGGSAGNCTLIFFPPIVAIDVLFPHFNNGDAGVVIDQFV